MKTYSLALKIGLIGILTVPLRLYFEPKNEKNIIYNVNHGSVDLNAPTAVKMFNSIEIYSMKYNIPLKYALGIAYAETRYQGLYDKYGNWKIVFGCYNTGRPCVNGYAEKVYNFNPKLN